VVWNYPMMVVMMKLWTLTTQAMILWDS
jgi:hypothetical protein